MEERTLPAIRVKAGSRWPIQTGDPPERTRTCPSCGSAFVITDLALDIIRCPCCGVALDAADGSIAVGVG